MKGYQTGVKINRQQNKRKYRVTGNPAWKKPKKLFEESDFENLGDLERRKMVLDALQEELNEMFTGLVLYMYENLEHFGETLMVDGKAIKVQTV